MLFFRCPPLSLNGENITHLKDHRPVNLHPLFLKIGHPAFWKMGHPAFCKKQAEKNRVILYSKREETRLPLLFLNYNDLCFFQKAGCPIFKNSGCRLTGRFCFLLGESCGSKMASALCFEKWDNFWCSENDTVIWTTPYLVIRASYKWT